jgi:type II secretory pathway pseudopilin PulG
MELRTPAGKFHARGADVTRLQAGFTYLGILLAVAILGVMLAAAGTLWSTAAQRDREAELLFVGEAYRAAIESYYRNGSGAGQLPRELQDLVEDRRSLVLRRHLRRLYFDPMTGGVDWDVVRTADGGILGVRSSSRGVPLKKANFSVGEQDFADAQCYCDWQFVFNTARARRLPRQP